MRQNASYGISCCCRSRRLHHERRFQRPWCSRTAISRPKPRSSSCGANVPRRRLRMRQSKPAEVRFWRSDQCGHWRHWSSGARRPAGGRWATKEGCGSVIRTAARSSTTVAPVGRDRLPDRNGSGDTSIAANPPRIGTANQGRGPGTTAPAMNAATVSALLSPQTRATRTGSRPTIRSLTPCHLRR